MNQVTVADVVRRYTDALRAGHDGWLPYSVERVLRDIAQCRTAALGGHLYACEKCDAEVPVYNSCQNRHCPQCQSRARNRWLEARMNDLLPVPYFHLVFTVPAEARPFFRADPRALYSLLFRSVWDTVRQTAEDPKRLGARPGALAVLHTWNQQLLLHPHLHLVVPGGGLDREGRWVPSKPKFLIHVRALSKLFAGRFLHHLDRAVSTDAVRLPKDMRKSPSLYVDTRETLRHKRWVVYAKRPFGGPEQVLRYLARYTHRVAIGNSRMVSHCGDRVTFRYKTRSADPEWKLRELDAVEFLRRFVLHVLPPGFVRIRYYGFLSHRHRRQAVETIREQLGVREVAEAIEGVEKDRSSDLSRWLHCEKGLLVEIRPLSRDLTMSSRGPPS